MKVRELEYSLVLNAKLALYSADGELLYAAYPGVEEIPEKLLTYEVLNVLPINDHTVGATIDADTSEVGEWLM